MKRLHLFYCYQILFINSVNNKCIVVYKNISKVKTIIYKFILPGRSKILSYTVIRRNIIELQKLESMIH